MFGGETAESSNGNSSIDDLANMPSFEEHMEQMNREKNRETSPEKIENFNRLVRFLKNDLSIKESLIDMAPSNEDFSSAGEGAYLDDFYYDFRDIDSSMRDIMKDYYPSEVFEQKLNDWRQKVIENSGSAKKIAKLYSKEFTPISKEFIDKVHNNLVGYTDFDPHALDEDVHSVNEMLHLMHSSIVNNEQILQDLPVLDKSEQGSVVLYGTGEAENNVAEGIFRELSAQETGPYDFCTDIVLLKDRTLMMARDRGHALTVDIQKDSDGKMYVNYFIPKICNARKVNSLPGVRKVPENAPALTATTGVFNTESEADATSKVVEFLNMVPTDDDIEYSRAI